MYQLMLLYTAVCQMNTHCNRDKDQEISSLRSELAAAKHRISLDERASKVTSSIDTAGMSLHTQSQVERLEAANAQLEVSLQQSLQHLQLLLSPG